MNVSEALPGLPQVSVVTPVYNGGEYLAQCIESVISQSYGNWEYIIVDNCSTDNSLDIANTYAERVAGQVDPRFVMHTVLESTLSTETTDAVTRADSRQQALALLFMSPEIQRR